MGLLEYWRLTRLAYRPGRESSGYIQDKAKRKDDVLVQKPGWCSKRGSELDQASTHLQKSSRVRF